MPLPVPTVELVLAQCELFDRENEFSEDAIRQLLETYPNNTNPPGVLLKVAVINQLYRTNVFDVQKLARHIAALGIDSLLKTGAPEAVCRIADLELGRAKVLLSFATKYCSWHNLAAYPIFDSNVDRCLWEYKKRDEFVEWGYSDLDSGTASSRCHKFLQIVAAFRKHYDLESVTFKQLDKFLYRKGVELGSSLA